MLDLLIFGQIHGKRLLQFGPYHAFGGVLDERAKALLAVRQRLFVILAFQFGSRARRGDLEQRFRQLGVGQRPLVMAQIRPRQRPLESSMGDPTYPSALTVASIASRGNSCRTPLGYEHTSC